MTLSKGRYTKTFIGVAIMSWKGMAYRRWHSSPGGDDATHQSSDAPRYHNTVGDDLAPQ